MHNLRATILLVNILFFSFSVSGQKLINSPYSRFNIGSLEPAGSFRSISMGGIGTAIRDNSSIYYQNPASYSSIDTNSFVFDFGLDYGMDFLTEGSSNYFSDDMNFDHILLGFPLARGFGITAGLIPFSNGYYKITEEVTELDPEYDEQTGEYVALHTGEGGFSKLFLGAGLNITKYFSVGANMTIIFGDITRANQIIFGDYYVFHDNTSEKLHLSGINFEYGAQYILPLGDDYFVNAGISLTPGMKYNSDYENLTYLFSAFGSVDTLSYMKDRTKAFLPRMLRSGISFGKINKFTAGFDYAEIKWSEATISGTGAYYADTRSYKFGAEYIPQKYSNYSFLSRVEYRIGGHLEDYYLKIDGTQVKELGISLGFGIPMRRSISKTNIFFDYTKRYGSDASLFHIENQFTIGLSLNMYDRWFLKPIYD
jgi:hypothetical protein